MAKRDAKWIKPEPEDEPSSPPRVGARVRRLRLANNKTLRELATDLGVAPSALSMLENDQAGVSLQRLQHIAQHFGVTIVDLLADRVEASQVEEPVQVIRRAQATTPSHRRGGSGVLYQVPAVTSGHMIQPSFVTFLPGGGYTRDKIGHAGEETVLVLAGEIELHHGDEVTLLAQGDVAVFQPTCHTLSAMGRRTVRRCSSRSRPPRGRRTRGRAT